MNFNTKNKTLLFIIAIFAINTLLFGFVVYQNSQKELDEIKKISYEKIQSSFQTNINVHYVDFFQNKAQEIVTPHVVDLIKSKDKERLYEHMLPIYRSLQRDKALEQLHFHLSDGKTLLRVHNKDMHGDDVSSFRLMANEIKKSHRTLFGFEEGLSGVSYRVFTPIFSKDEYLGALEFGVSPEYILKLVTKFNSVSGLIYLEQQNDNALKKDIQYTSISDNFYLSIIDKLPKFEKQHDMLIEGRLIALYSFEIYNYSKQKVGSFIFFNDLTKYKNSFENTMIKFMLISVLSLITLIIIANFGFNILITTLQSSYDTIKRYTSIVDKNVITSSTDLAGNIIYVSEAFCNISGYSKDELIGKNHRIVRHKDMPKSLYKELWSDITNNKIWEGEIKNKKKNGDFYWVKASISPIFNENGAKVGYTAIRQDITDKKIIEEISITDGLTNIYNRRHFNDTFPKVINSAKRNDELVCFLLMDIDHFKQYNDNYGHQMGDDVLIKFASSLKNSLQCADDLAFRLGGEEFGIVFKSENKEKALEFANRVRQNIQELQITHDYSSASKYVTASMGLVCKKASEITDMDSIYKESDDLLYLSKESGRNRVSVNG